MSNRITDAQGLHVSQPFGKHVLADGTGNLVELFAGSRSVGSVAEAKGMNVFSVELKERNYELGTKII